MDWARDKNAGRHEFLSIIRGLNLVRFGDNRGVENQLTFPLPQTEVGSKKKVLNNRCFLFQEGEQWIIVAMGVPAYRYQDGDDIGEAYAMVFLVSSGYATQAEVARVYGCDVRTVRRHQRRYESGGMAALATRSGWRPGRKRLPVKRRMKIEKMHAEGLSNREIARRLLVSEKAIRKQVGPTKDNAAQLTLPLLLSREVTPDATTKKDSVEKCSAPETPSEAQDSGTTKGSEARVEGSCDIDPRNRVADRSLARLGLLSDAAPMFADAKGVKGAGMLFALPALIQSGVFRVAAKLYGDIGPAFYGLRTTFLVLLFMALSRIKRPENLKEIDPALLGFVLGLDRAPEMKTVRRKLTRLAARHKAEELGQELARIRVEQHSDAMGFLYIDGHVRAYHGERDIPKAHVARIRVAMPAASDYWVNDTAGDPLFVVAAEANEGLSKMLPKVLSRIRTLFPERRVTVVFDRGGWKLELFKYIIDELGFDILTYRKGVSPLIDPSLFSLHETIIDGKRVEYTLHDQTVSFLDGTLSLRQVTKLSDNNHQTQIVTSRFDLNAAEVAFRMFERWRQENYFRYARIEFALDALVDYQVEPGDPTRTVPNPEKKEVAKQIKSERMKIKSLEQSLGAELLVAKNKNQPILPSLSNAYSNIETALKQARDNLTALLAKRKETPTRVEIRDISEGAVVKLAFERKHLTDIIKMLAYQAESDLLALIEPYYNRTEDEGRTLIHEIISAKGDLHIDGSVLTVTLDSLSSPHRTEVVSQICQTLTDSLSTFPGSNLRLRFDIRPRPKIGLAFPGPRPHLPPKPDISPSG